MGDSCCAGSSGPTRSFSTRTRASSLPYGAGIVVVRNAQALAAAHEYEGAYMQDAERGPGETSPADLSAELSKHSARFACGLPLMLVGTGPFRAALEEKLLLARYFHEEVRALGFECGPPPELSIVTYRWAPPGAGPAAVDRINQAIVDGVRRDGRVFLSSTLLDGGSRSGWRRWHSERTGGRSIWRSGAAGAGGGGRGVTSSSRAERGIGWSMRVRLGLTRTTDPIPRSARDDEGAQKPHREPALRLGYAAPPPDTRTFAPATRADISAEPGRRVPRHEPADPASINSP